MKYRISEMAAADIENIWLYTFEQWDIRQADRYINLIVQEIEYIALNPLSGKDYSHVRNGYYKARVKSHFIFYKINTSNKTVDIIRILHQQMDIDTRLED